MAILFLDFFGSDPSKMDQTHKFGEQSFLVFYRVLLHLYRAKGVKKLQFLVTFNAIFLIKQRGGGGSLKICKALDNMLT